LADFYADHNVAIDLAALLRERGHPVTTARDVDLEAAADEVQLLTAAKLGRILKTDNVKDFFLLHDAWQLWSTEWEVTAKHSGTLVIPAPPRWSSARAAEELDTFIRINAALPNNLFVWQPSRGWVQRK
jgi:hypothetical protein